MTIREQGSKHHRPVLSISMLSYNQAEYLPRAIESILDQRLTVPCEIIIGDDCSSDESQQVLQRYQREYPELIRLHLHTDRVEAEIPGRRNNVTNLLACRGEFTAMLDADDYYIDPDKLQRQVDILTAHPDLSMSCHESFIEWGPESPRPNYRSSYRNKSGVTITTGIYGHDDLTRRYSMPFHISSIMFRTVSLRPLPDWFGKILSADQAIFYLLTMRGDYHYDERPGSIRYFSGKNYVLSSEYRSLESVRLKLRETKIFYDHFPGVRKHQTFRSFSGRLHLRLVKPLAAEGKLGAAANHLVRAAKDLYPELNFTRVKKVLFS
ncbi:glycosyltransferase family 2 protein [Neolewinella antarctica]|uniref:Glycosyltransferase involved in cell wall biosynthesis n=1 Tax=Neolewinella antarctica TaxID=442734 RepID=A0ABX0XB57_9BACT|nr:glycosyltransferase family 2 protein [Neolewinella antarctica]NJC26300.1 glycosyltransferase involved in cell wall biosynthesis [Neolewinella antarctica]